MNPSRLALWLIGAAVCGAWFASAAGVTREARRPPVTPASADVVQLNALATEVQAQAERLRDKLAGAPAPSPYRRNPFAFGPAPAPVRHSAAMPSRDTATIPVSEPAPAESGEPSIQLIGIAESKEGEELVRTAMMTGEFIDLIMATAGDRILERYEILTITENTVELKDLATGAVRRLILQ
jgi:hypothetical protein